MNLANCELLYAALRRDRKVAVRSGLLSGVMDYKTGRAAPHAWYRGYSHLLDTFSVFTAGAVLGVPELAIRDEDYDVSPKGREPSDQDYVAWVNYLQRVYDVRVYDAEWRLVDAHEWRTKHPMDSKANGIRRLRYAIDNDGLLDMATVESWLQNPDLAEFDLGLDYADL